MKGSYQHIAVRLVLLPFLTGIVNLCAQPTGQLHTYRGIPSFNNKNINPQEVLFQLNNSGYPYAQIELDTLVESEGKSILHWNVSLGNLVLLDTLITSNNLFNKKTMQRCINYQLGQPYSLEKIKNITVALNQISFIKPNSPVTVRMLSESFSIILKPERRKTNQLSALVALQPRPGTSQSMLTGNFDLELSNALKQAETIEFHWKRPQPQSQSLSFKLGSPFTAGLPVGFQFEFASFLRDSTFSSTDLSFRVLTKMNDLNGFSAAITKSTNTHFSASSNFGNTQIQTYSLRYSKFNNVENSINFLFEGTAGSRSIQYESNSTKKKLYGLRGKIWSDFLLSKILFLKLNLEGNAIYSDSLFDNEITRLGGTKNLRAFIEESIFASRYAMLNCDFGISLGADIQSFIFGDLAYVNAPNNRTYYDTGIGFRFQQENGAVGITYGVGNIENNALQLSNGRIGITFSSRF